MCNVAREVLGVLTYPRRVGGDIAGVRDVGAYRNVDMGRASPRCCLVARRILN